MNLKLLDFLVYYILQVFRRIGVIISDEPRINEEIRVPQVRLIGPKGEQVGVIATSVALNLAREANLDLVEVAPTAKPPVCLLYTSDAADE